MDDFLSLAKGWGWDNPDPETAERNAEHLACEVTMDALTPAYTALLQRTLSGRNGTLTETMWVHGYVLTRLLVINHPQVRLCDGSYLPGVVRDIPIGERHLTDQETFVAFCDKQVAAYERNGFVRQPHEVSG